MPSCAFFVPPCNGQRPGVGDVARGKSVSGLRYSFSTEEAVVLLRHRYINAARHKAGSLSKGEAEQVLVWVANEIGQDNFGRTWQVTDSGLRALNFQDWVGITPLGRALVAELRRISPCEAD